MSETRFDRISAAGPVEKMSLHNGQRGLVIVVVQNAYRRRIQIVQLPSTYRPNECRDCDGGEYPGDGEQNVYDTHARSPNVGEA